MRQTYWQARGGVFDDSPSPEEALERAGLDFEAQIRADAHLSADGETWIQNGSKFHVVRADTDESLGVVGGRFRPTQHGEAAQVVCDMLAEADLTVETCWSGLNGARAAMALRFGGDVDIDGDVVRPYLIWSNAHDGKESIKIAVTAIQVACTNQLPRLFRQDEKRSQSVVHSSTSCDRLTESARAIAMAVDYVDDTIGELRRLSTIEISDRKAKIVLKRVVELDHRQWQREAALESMVTLFAESPTAENVKPNSAYRLLHAITEHYDHVAQYRTPEARERGLTLGPAFRVKREAAKILAAL